MTSNPLSKRGGEASSRSATGGNPCGAILEGGRVLVPTNGTLEERGVEVGLRNWEYVEVRGGLESGQQVVVSLGRLEVKPGARVRIEETDGRAR